MKSLISKKKYLILLSISIIFLFSGIYTFAYDEKIVHPSLTAEMAKMYNLNYADKLTDQEIEWMKKGSKDEDDRQGLLIRSGNHFYNPFGFKKWADDTLIGNIVPEPKLTAKEWLHDSLEQDSFPGGDFTWERAIWDYANGDKQHAYESLGHALHLIEDATVPAHVRNDLHISPNDKDLAPYQNLPRFEEIKKALQDGEPYESWTGGKAWSGNLKFDFADNLRDENKKPIILSNIDQYFDNIAGYTNTNFFSKDTIYAYSNPKILFEKSEKLESGKTVIYGYGINEYSENFRLAKLDDSSDNRAFVINTNIDGMDQVNSDYWSHLAPRAVLTGAGIIKLFKDEANQAAQNPQSVSRPKSIASAYGPLAPAIKTADPAIRQVATFGQLLANAGIYAAKSAIGAAGNTISGIFSPAAKAQLEFNIADSLPAGIYNISDMIKQTETSSSAKIPIISEPVYDAALLVLNQKQNREFAPGEEIKLSAQIKNTGSAAWPGDKISLNIYSAESANFYHSSWLTAVRPAGLNNENINPGAGAVLSFAAKAPLKPGDYFFRARPVWQSDGGEFNWLGKDIALWPIKVKAPIETLVEAEDKEQIAAVNDTKENTEDISGQENNLPEEDDKSTVDANIEKQKMEPEALALESARLKEEEEFIMRRRRSWAIIPPETTILEFPANPTFENRAVFKFSSSKGNYLFDCALDGAGFAPCRDITTYENLSAGAHNLKVKARDEYGNVDETPAEYSWLISAPKNPHLVISEIIFDAQGSDAGKEFIELYNPTADDVNLAGWSLKYTKDEFLEMESLATFGEKDGILISKNGFFLIGFSNYSANNYNNILADAARSASLPNGEKSGEAQKIAIILLDNQGKETDRMIYDKNSISAAGQSLERKALKDGACVSSQGRGEFLGNGCDTGDPSDFEIRIAPNPQNSGSIAEPAPTPVHNIASGFDYPVIQWAIDNANPGDEIQVDSGTYYENINVNKRLNLIGVDTGLGKPVVDAKGIGSAITIAVNGSTIEGFKAISSNANKKWYSGIEVKSNNNIIKDNDVSGNYYGILLDRADNNILSGNTADSNAYDGIVLANSDYNTINNNIATNNSYGIQIGDNSYNNTFSNNIAKFNINAGFFIGYGYENTLNNNTIKSNSYGIFIFSGVRNKIYRNNFINKYNVDDRSGTTNIWDDGYPGGGNYWSDYVGIDLNSGLNQDQPGGDGIGDKPYGIVCNNFNTCGGTSYDRYPLMEER